MPDNVSAAAAGIAITSSGALASYTTTPLMSPEDATEAMRKAATIAYRPPA